MISSPLDFRTDSTPEVGRWVTDLNNLFLPGDPWQHAGRAQLFYEFRLFERNCTSLTAQVVGKRKLGDE